MLFHQEFISRFCQYIEITPQQFWDNVEKYRNEEIWEKATNGEWKLQMEYE